MTTQTPIPPGFMRMGSKIVPQSAPFGAVKKKLRKFLIVLQFFEGDRMDAEDLISLIGELERTMNKEADLFLLRRADCRPINPVIVKRLKLKFEVVHEQACRRLDAKAYPMGPNQMFGDLMMWMAHTAPFKDDYYAFVNLEPDAVPLRPGWISDLIMAHREAQALGFGATGYIHDNPVRHLNGLAVWEQPFLRRVPQLMGANPRIAYDIWHANRVLPHATSTSKIRFAYRTPTITPEALFSENEDGTTPCLFHGVKDDSARKAVRARFVTFTDVPPPKQLQTPPEVPNGLESQPVASQSATPAGEDFIPEPLTLTNVGELAGAATKTTDLMALSRGPSMPPPKKGRQNVYTYAHKHKAINPHEMKAMLEVWKKGWSAQGWNPVVLTVRDAAKHLKFDELSAKVEKLPCSGDKHRQLHRFLRWLALDQVGGGLLVDWDVLPDEKLTPGFSFEDPTVLRVGNIVGIYTEKTKEVVAALMAYEPSTLTLSEIAPHVTDVDIFRDGTITPFAFEGFVRHFSAASLGTKRKSVAMEEFLAQPVPAHA